MTQTTAEPREARPPQPAPAPPASQKQGRVHTLLNTMVVWYWYVPHLAMVRMLGPRVSVRWARIIAWLHWLPIYFGAHRTALEAIEATREHLQSDLSSRTIMRKCLENKHHLFVLWNMATTKRGRRYILRGCTDFEGRENIKAALAENKGMLILSFHYGIGRILALTMTNLYGAEEVYELSHLTDTYSAGTLPRVARIAHNSMLYTEAKSGLRTWEVSPNRPPFAVLRQLRRGAIVALAGDGYVATDFVEVPFLGGTLSLPTGVARLAAMTGAPIIPLFGVFETLRRHKITAYPPIYCRENTREAHVEAVAACARVLEDYVKREPWGWWIWHRIKFETSPDGSRHIRAIGSANFGS